MSSNEQAPDGLATENEYTSRTGQKSHIPVQSDDATVEDPIDPATADSDQQLEKDDADAIDRSNIVDSRTRAAAKGKGGYAEPGDEEGLPSGEDGTSSGRQ
ncbi:hypothetical protein M409DRAFT_22641 [Zasmidium cellare ATCC 36951]|uniref:Histone chaperone domain-containing protein n=1 Tax=Zasmidium cellare ATCC 36951 TaxID=1080233 RepID=A0A6A6CMR6_ZASCE|nr:uncharacterized protein M409DRAFT_22641 [Zasmidium cellare ATCC 36951]KAF2167212.1 hypothetical protein M409DRAFT_22641 [Zasmidium cellare ATCC 36951]